MTGLEFSVNGISSYYYYNSCNAQRLFTDTYYGGVRSDVLYGDRAYVGDIFNDNIYSMMLFNR